VLHGDTQEARSLCEVSFVLSAAMITEHNVYLPGASRAKFYFRNLYTNYSRMFYTGTVLLKTETVHYLAAIYCHRSLAVCLHITKKEIMRSKIKHRVHLNVIKLFLCQLSLYTGIWRKQVKCISGEQKPTPTYIAHVYI
jgi:hypothetical protein